MGVKRKSLFDHIIEDTVALNSLAKTIRVRQFKKIECSKSTDNNFVTEAKENE
jgi:hypothetical protein